MAVRNRAMSSPKRPLSVVPCFFAFCLLAACLLVQTLFATAAASAENLTSQLDKEITALFPDATTIGQKQQDVPVWPVFKGDELLGYAFQSVDLVSFRGWSGHPINMLIGLD
ncbi:hypothetical protein, partial [Porticoccus sp.]